MKKTILIILWMAIGVNLLIYDWTRNRDMTVKDAVVVGVCGSALGPFAILAVIISSDHEGPVLIKKHTKD